MSGPMRDSGVDWLGKIPAHWDVVPPAALFTESKERARDGDQMLSATQKYGVVPLADFEAMEQRQVTKAVANLDKRKHVEVGDFVISMRSMDGGLERSRAVGSVRSSYSVLKAGPDVDGRFFGALMKSSLFIQALRLTSNFIRDGQDLNFSHVRKIRLPKLGRVEQAAIADYLDRATARIDALVAKKTRFIELTREKIIALSTRAQADDETRWTRLKLVADVVSRPVEQLNGESYTRLGLYNRGRGIFKKDSSDAEDMGDSSFHWVRDGDLIISGQFAWEGAVAMARSEHDGCVVSHRYPILRGRDGEVLSDYLLAYFLTMHGDAVMNDCSRGSAGRNRPLNVGLLMNWKVPIPSMEIQKRIVTLMSKKEKAEVLQKKSVALLKERRTALIAAAVTGKIDLSNAA